MLFHKCIDQENIPLKLPLLQLNSNIIERENSLKFLGVILDKHLTWKKQTQLIENKVSKNVGVLYKASKLINSKCLRSIYFSFIHSYINYANINYAWATSIPKIFETKSSFHVTQRTTGIVEFLFFSSFLLVFTKFSF